MLLLSSRQCFYLPETPKMPDWHHPAIMAHGGDGVSKAQSSGKHLRLRIPEVEKVFVQVAIDVKVILVLDGVDQLTHPPGFHIRSHDLYGPLPTQ